MLVPCLIPTAQRRWETEGMDFGVDWSNAYEMPFKVTKSTRLQSFQYKNSPQILPYEAMPIRMYVRSVVDDPFCNNCGETETIEH